MKLTKQLLKQTIKEELKDIKEVGGPWGPERYNPEDPSNTPEAIAKDEATTAMVNGLRAHLKNRGDLTPEALQHVVLDVEEALVAGLEGIHIPAPEVSTDAESDDDSDRLHLQTPSEADMRRLQRTGAGTVPRYRPKRGG